jgi:uncharacterized protein YdhG (YjbR/CyaY superfamily)
MQKISTVDAYIASAPQAIQGKLNDIRRTIKKAAPKAEEKISYSMPYYGYKGRLAYFAYFKDHISFFTMPPIPPEYVKKLNVTGKATIQFGLNEKIPLALIARLVQEGVKRNEANSSKKEVFDGIGAPAERALMNANITTLKQLATYSESELLELHGMGPQAIGILKKLLKAKGLGFKQRGGISRGR